LGRSSPRTLASRTSRSPEGGGVWIEFDYTAPSTKDACIAGDALVEAGLAEALPHAILLTTGIGERSSSSSEP
jgi:hypothetical protein